MRTWLAMILCVLWPVMASAQQSVVEKYRVAYPTPMSNEQLVSLLKQIAADVGGGLLKKDGGDNCNGYACDVICFADGRLYDVLVNKHGAAQPAWQGPDQLAGRTCELVRTAPPPVVSPPPPVPSDHEARLAALEARVAALERAGPIGPPPSGTPSDVVVDIKRIRVILEAIVAKYGNLVGLR